MNRAPKSLKRAGRAVKKLEHVGSRVYRRDGCGEGYASAMIAIRSASEILARNERFRTS
jgi:hypothetical protein